MRFAGGRSGEEVRGVLELEAGCAIDSEFTASPKAGKGFGAGRGTVTAAGSREFGGARAARTSEGAGWVRPPPKVRVETDCAECMAIWR